MKCPHCGGTLPEAESLPTEVLPESPTVVPRPSLDVSGGARPPGSAQLQPGAVLAGRYRIVSLAGRGAMGEVYRAEDLRLDQTVALKFLPPALADDPERLARLLNEVRIARQVSHPNVCRVYDVGETDGRPFLTMEFIAGEDLASLLRRKGRLPENEAFGIARQLCAGLAAAHERGVLHRDLKPSNVMVDDRGVARITDFGLAEAGVAIVGRKAREGTPSFMAPEQLAGTEVTQQSDIYALGLMLYEIFAGRSAFPEPGADPLAQRRTAPPPAPASVARGVDPSVSRLVLRCLDPDPAQRPRTARAVTAALPGGLPLGAALAAAQERADRISAFRSELTELRRSGVIHLSETDLSAVEKHHAGVLRDLVQHFDVDVTERGKQLSLGMRVVALVAALALAASVFYFFYRVWGLISLPVQVGVLVVAPLAALALTSLIAARDRSGYFTLMAAVLAFVSLVLDTVVLTAVLGVRASPHGFLIWGVFALILAYGYGLRLPLLAGVFCLALWVAAIVAFAAGYHWPSFLMRPEGLLPVGVLAFLLHDRASRRFHPGFALLLRILGLLLVLVPVLIVGRNGYLSYLPFDPKTTAIGHQVFGFALGAGAVWLGLARRWKEAVYGGGACVVLMMYLKFVDWWWNWMPKYLFFLIVAASAIGVLWILMRVRATLAALSPEART